MKNFLRKIISKFSKYSSIYENAFDLLKVIDYHNIDIVLDVGASWGGYAKTLRRFGFKKEIISFEPISTSHKKLLKNSLNDESWRVHKKIIITDKVVKKLSINVSVDFDNSSLLNSTNLHIENHQDAKSLQQEETECDSLDSLIDHYDIHKKNIMLKIDVQGSEMNVLKSGITNLKKFKLVQVELSLQPLYEKQILWKEIVDFMNDKGFDIWTIYPGYKKKSIAQLYQFDAIFYNKDFIEN
tara:strand:+ start:156 stop:878 length:723 start_codon:yes stop_codon:yes gene_type:complete